MARVLAVLLCILGVTACEGGPGSPCADGVAAGSCEDMFCGEPTLVVAAVEYGAGGALLFTPLSNGSPATVVKGAQPGFHISAGVETTNLCSVLYLDFTIDVPAAAEGEPLTILHEQRHVQSLRCARLLDDAAPGVTAQTCAEQPTFQRWWDGGRLLNIPCDQRPLYGDQSSDCPDPPTQPIDEHPAWLTVTARDHDDRTVTTTVEIDPVFTPE